MSHEGNGPQAPEALDRKAMLLEQFNEVEAAPHSPEDPKPAEAAPAGDRPRDETGKFVAKEKTETPAPEAAPALEAAPAWSKAPKSWKPEKHPLWETMSPEAREYAFQREEQMRAGVEPLLPKAQLADQITKVAEPYMNTIRGMGIDLPTAVEGLMKVDHELRTLPPQQKLQRFLGIAQAYGIDLSGAQGMPQQPVQDPNFYAIQNEVLGLKGELSAWRQQQEEIANRAVLNEINEFARHNEHFAIARPFMIDLLTKEGDEDGASSLQEAYDKVTGPGGVLHDLIATSKQAAAIPAQRAQADKAAKAARAAAVSVKSSTPGSQKPNGAQSRREMLAEQIGSIDSRL